MWSVYSKKGNWSFLKWLLAQTSTRCRFSKTQKKPVPRVSLSSSINCSLRRGPKNIVACAPTLRCSSPLAVHSQLFFSSCHFLLKFQYLELVPQRIVKWVPTPSCVMPQCSWLRYMLPLGSYAWNNSTIVPIISMLRGVAYITGTPFPIVAIMDCAAKG